MSLSPTPDTPPVAPTTVVAPLNTHAIGFASFGALALAVVLDPGIRATLSAAILTPTTTSIVAVIVGLIAFVGAYLSRPVTVPQAPITTTEATK
jgi:hypothetical protein